MFLIDEDEDKDKKIVDQKDDNSKYEVEEEKIQTIFHDEVKEPIIVDEDDEDFAPQNKEDYQVQSQLIEENTEQLTAISVSSEMRKSFLEYAMSVIVARALPDARDGLKPVHRRILYGMHELNITASSQHKKSARIVGDVLGKYHPHGDSAVYEAMVRMAQEFSMRYPLVDGHGNFGSIDGDSAAAMRYTEARMSKIAMLMVDGMKKNTVDFVPNYDASDTEPIVLPSKIPNLLVSGATGIAVGMATSIPPHNLTEVINGVVALARNKDITCEELMTHITGPDFPTGGIILGSAGIRQGYETGRGGVGLRSKTRIEELKNGRYRIIVEEIPYMVNKANMIEKIAELVKNKVIDGITDLRDESSRQGIRIVIDVKRDVVPEVLLNQLFKTTQLQVKFSMNMLALVKGQPEVLNLKRALEVYLEHQKEVVRRRSQFDLDKAEARAHILQGLKIAIQNIDEVISIVRNSKTDTEAQDKLKITFNLSDEQAKSITEMRLGRLTGLAIEKMNEELLELESEIKSLRNILDNENVLIDLIISELEDIKNKYGDSRRSEIVEGLGEIEDEDLIPQKDIAILMSSKGYVKRIPLEEYASQNRGGVGSKTMTTYEDDHVERILVTNTHTDLLIFTTLGKVYRIRGHQIPELSKQAKGIPFVNLIQIEKDLNEQVIAMLNVDSYEEGKYLFTITKNGVVKKTDIRDYLRINSNGKIALGMKEDDLLVKAMIVQDNDEIIIGSSLGKVVRFEANQVRSMGRTATGVRGINLSDDAKTVVVGADIVKDDQYILSIGANGFGKKTIAEEYRKTNRGAKGVKSLNVDKAGQLKYVGVVTGNEDILVVTKDGITIRTTLEQVSTTSRGTKGVKIIKLNDGNAIKSVAVVDEEKIAQQADEVIKKTQEISLEAIEAITKETSE